MFAFSKLGTQQLEWLEKTTTKRDVWGKWPKDNTSDNEFLVLLMGIKWILQNTADREQIGKLQKILYMCVWYIYVCIYINAYTYIWLYFNKFVEK